MVDDTSRRRVRNPGRRGRGTRGSVSIYFIAVTAAFVLLTGMLIDFARLSAYRKQAELSVKSGARSVLSAYDPELYGRYGLFALGGGVANDTFLHTLEGNQELEAGDSFRLLRTKWGETEVMESRPLGSHAIFRRQVLEDMKYRAPIDLSIELASRFKGLPSVMKEAKQTTDVLEKVKKAYERREASLDKALESQIKAGEKVLSAFHGMVPFPPVSLGGGRAAGGVKDIADAALMYADYTAKREEDAARAESRRQRLAEQARKEEERRQNAGNHSASPSPTPTQAPANPEPDDGPRHTAAIEAYEAGVRVLAGKLSDASKKGEEAAEKVLAAALVDIQDAQAANEEIKSVAIEAGLLDSSGSVATDPGEFGGGQSEELIRLRKAVTELILIDSYFSDYIQEVEKQKADDTSLKNQAMTLSGTISSALGSSGMVGTLLSETAQVQQANAALQEAYGQTGQVIERRRAMTDDHRASDQQRKAMEQEAKSAWSEAASFMATLSGLKSPPEDIRADFEALDRAYKDNLAWNKEQEESAVRSRPGNASEGRDDALENTNGWLGALTDSVLGQRDALYFAEYTMNRYTHTEPSSVKAMLSGGGDDLMRAEGQETEYVLYGLSNPAANISAAYGEVFAFRLAIRMMEGLIECRAYGNPLIVLVAATLYAIRGALTDMKSLLDTGKIALSKYAKVDTTYDDYLRFFLLLHGDSASQVARRIAVIEWEMKASLKEAYTYVSGHGTASLELWFLPGAMKVLGRDGGWGGTVKGNRYEANFTADFSYQ